MKVILAPCAVRDVEEIVQYMRARDSAEAARHVLDGLEHVISSLSALPSRGACVKELEALGIKSFRELYYKSFRVIYEVETDEVHVFCVADGRRDMVSLLEKRILGL
jgi:toxin ParE1/3/4